MILGNLGKAKYFTTLDLKSGYHQITLAERDREKTSFLVNGGKYGLRDAASIFHSIPFCESRSASSATFTSTTSSSFQKMKMPMSST